MSGTRPVSAPVSQFGEVYYYVSKAIGRDIRERAALCRADLELSAAVKMIHEAGGSWRLGLPGDQVITAVMSDKAIFGVKASIVQMITGISLGAPSTTGSIEHVLLPTARLFGIEKAVRAEAQLDHAGEDADFKIEFDVESPIAESKKADS